MPINILTDIYAHMRQFERAHGLSALELHAVLELLHEDGQRLVALGNKIGSPWGISANIGALEAKGWVYRERSERTSNHEPVAVYVFLTDKGLSLSGEFEQLQSDIETLVVQNWEKHL